MTTFEQFTNNFIRQQEITSAMIQLESQMDILRKNQTNIVRDWFRKTHPDLAFDMIDHPTGKENFICYIVGVSDKNPMGTHISIRFLVGIDNDITCPMKRKLMGEDSLIWIHKCYPLTDLQDIDK